MPLTDPPADARLRTLPRRSLAGTSLYRVYRAARRTPWFFAGLTPGVVSKQAAGRFDLPSPHGTCYLADSPCGSVLEALQGFGEGLLPESELRVRHLARLVAPSTAPGAADLTHPAARGLGVTQALWAAPDRATTQQWAAALHRAGWQALHAGLQHDPGGGMRAVALFDLAGAHAPYDDAAAWPWTSTGLGADRDVRLCLAAHGITVTADPEIVLVRLEDSGLL